MNIKIIISLLALGIAVAAPLMSSAQNNPSIDSISPSGAIIGSSDITLTVTGTGFVSDSVVNFDGSDKDTTYVSSTQLIATIPEADLDTTGIYDVMVANPDGGTSDAIEFTVSTALPNTGFGPGINTFAFTAGIISSLTVLLMFALRHNLFARK